MHHWIVNIFGQELNMDTLLTMWLAMGFLIIMAIIATRKISIIPNKVQFVFENILTVFYNLADSMMEKEGRKHIPLIASLFLFIVTANLMGQVPLRIIELKQGEFASPTNDLNVTAALAILVLVYYLCAGLAKKKFKFLLHDFSLMSLLMLALEILDMITRPLTLALRLFGNILAGECLVAAIMGICAYLLPIPVMIFEILVACVQALVFSMLTMVYISLAVNEEH